MSAPFILGVSAVPESDERDMIEDTSGDHYEMWVGDFQTSEEAEAYRAKLVEALETEQNKKDIAFRVSRVKTPDAWKTGTELSAPSSVEQVVTELTQGL